MQVILTKDSLIPINPAFFFCLCANPGEIRCYCDAPQCVATGYMCKSEINACFTKVRDALNTNSAINHGCLNPIAIDICSSSLKATDALTEALASTLKCCHNDMCNYRGLHALAQTRDSTGKALALALNYSVTSC